MIRCVWQVQYNEDGELITEFISLVVIGDVYESNFDEGGGEKA